MRERERKDEGRVVRVHGIRAKGLLFSHRSERATRKQPATFRKPPPPPANRCPRDCGIYVCAQKYRCPRTRNRRTFKIIFFFLREVERSSDDRSWDHSKNGYAIDIDSGNRRFEFLHEYNKNFIPTGVYYFRWYRSWERIKKLKGVWLQIGNQRFPFSLQISSFSRKIYSLAVAANLALEYQISWESFHILMR